MTIQLDLFGKRLRELRLDRKVSRRELADEIGVEQHTINRYENEICNPTLINVISIADFFGVSVNFLLGITE